jgi:hypothetical protein
MTHAYMHLCGRIYAVVNRAEMLRKRGPGAGEHQVVKMQEHKSARMAQEQQSLTSGGNNRCIYS